jgi:hypothetical protein
MRAIRAALGRPPITYWWYVAGTGVIYLMAWLPSSVETTYTWWGVGLELVLLVALVNASNLARWVLFAIGILAALGGLSVQGVSLDVVATAISAVTLCVSLLLLAPSMRSFTSNHDRGGARPEPIGWT